jgi:hypothetical protein
MASIRLAESTATPAATAVGIPVRSVCPMMPCSASPYRNVTAMASSSPNTSYRRQALTGTAFPAPVTQSGG